MGATRVGLKYSFLFSNGRPRLMLVTDAVFSLPNVDGDDNETMKFSHLYSKRQQNVGYEAFEMMKFVFVRTQPVIEDI